MNEQIVVKDNLISFTSHKTSEGEDAVVFLHGWRSSKEVWLQILGKLQNTQRSIYALDLPGFGASPGPKRDFTISDYAGVVTEFINKQNLGKVVLIGHSFGGRVGIKLASKHPEIIAKLILADSAGFAMQSGKKEFYGFLAKLAKPFFGLPVARGLRKRIYTLIGAEDYLATPNLQKTFVKVVSEDLTEDMKKITCPTLIVYGENDTDTPVEFGEQMHRLIRNSSLRIIAKAGHYSFLDQPEEFTQLLTEFISQ